MHVCDQCGTPRPESHCPHCGALPKSSAPLSPLVLGAVALLGLGLVSCDGPTAIYGAPDTGFLDADQDGVGAQQDCDDSNADIYPGATETAGDGVDSNCDGEDDT